MSTPGSFLLVGNTDLNGILPALKNSPEKAAPAILARHLMSFLTEFDFSVNNPDLITVSTEEENIGIDSVRQLRRQLDLRPTVSPLKIACIAAAEKLTVEAQNSLLKTLEEPPPDTLIILLVKDEAQLLPTILSRCQIIYLDEKSPAANVSDAKLAALNSADIGLKFALAKELSVSRENALNFVNEILLKAHSNLAKPTGITPKQIRSLLEAKRHLKANTNTRLTLENLLLNW